MEQKRRTMPTSKKNRKSKKIWMVLGIILGLALLFYASFKISYGLFSEGNSGKNEITQSTEEDIASMSREDLENKYKELKKQLEEKEDEIKMLEERLGNGGDTKATSAPSTPSPTSSPSVSDAPSSSPRQSSAPVQTSTPKPTAPPSAPNTSATQPPAQTVPPAPPAPTEAPKNLMTPEDLANMAGASGQ